MNIPDEYVIPFLSMGATVLGGAFAWYINQNKQNITDIENTVKELQDKIDTHEIAIHESRVRRQSDIEIMANLTKNMEALSEKLTELRIQLENKQTRI